MTVNYGCPIWLNTLVKKMSDHSHGDLQIECCLPSEVKQEYTLSRELMWELSGFSNIIAIYLKRGRFKSERLKYYKRDQRFINSMSLDISSQLICKMKLICNEGIFDPGTEQMMGLTMGIISRVQKNGFFKLCAIHEKFYRDISKKTDAFNDYELVHLIALKNILLSQSAV